MTPFLYTGPERGQYRSELVSACHPVKELSFLKKKFFDSFSIYSLNFISFSWWMSRFASFSNYSLHEVNKEPLNVRVSSRKEEDLPWQSLIRFR
jgi:hypothetical protein